MCLALFQVSSSTELFRIIFCLVFIFLFKFHFCVRVFFYFLFLLRERGVAFIFPKETKDKNNLFIYLFGFVIRRKTEINKPIVFFFLVVCVCAFARVCEHKFYGGITC